MNAYSDMLALPRPISRRHPQMRRADRAKQFMPFAALTGYEEIMGEKETLYEPFRELSEEQRLFYETLSKAVEERTETWEVPDLTEQEAAAVIAMAKRYGMIVATGHISAEEGLAVVRECAALGVQALVTHADNPADCYTTEQQQEAVSLGAVIEHCYFTTYYDRTLAHIVAEQIRAVGVENVILSTDFGQPKSPYSDEGLELYAQVMAKEGFTDGELTMMFRATPEKLLGIRRS